MRKVADKVSTAWKRVVERKVLLIFLSFLFLFLAFSVLADSLKAERDRLVKDLIRTSIGWHKIDREKFPHHWIGDPDGGDKWSGYAMPQHDLQNIASVAGISMQTMRRWQKEILQQTMEEAIAADKSTSEIEV